MTAILLKGSGGSQETTLDFTVSQEVADVLHVDSEVVYNNDMKKLVNAGYLRNNVMPEDLGHRAQNTYRTSFILGTDNRYVVTMTSKNSDSPTTSHPLYFKILDTITGEETSRTFSRTTQQSYHQMQIKTLSNVTYKDEYTVGLMQMGNRTDSTFRRAIPLVIEMLDGPSTLKINGRTSISGSANGSFELAGTANYMGINNLRYCFLGDGRFVFSYSSEANVDTRGYISSDSLTLSGVSTSNLDFSQGVTRYPGSFYPVGSDMYLSRRQDGHVVLNKMLASGVVDEVSTTPATTGGSRPALFSKVSATEYAMHYETGNTSVLYSVYVDVDGNTLSHNLRGTFPAAYSEEVIKLHNKFLRLGVSAEGASVPQCFEIVGTGAGSYVTNETYTKNFGVLINYASLTSSYDGAFITTSLRSYLTTGSSLTGIAPSPTVLNALGQRFQPADPILGRVVRKEGLKVTVDTFGYGTLSEGPSTFTGQIFTLPDDYVFSPKVEIKPITSKLTYSQDAAHATIATVKDLGTIKMANSGAEVFLVLDKEVDIDFYSSYSSSNIDIRGSYAVDGVIMSLANNAQFTWTDKMTYLNLKGNYVTFLSCRLSVTNTIGGQGIIAVKEGG